MMGKKGRRKKKASTVEKIMTAELSALDDGTRFCSLNKDIVWTLKKLHMLDGKEDPFEILQHLTEKISRNKERLQSEMDRVAGAQKEIVDLKVTLKEKEKTIVEKIAALRQEIKALKQKLEEDRVDQEKLKSEKEEVQGSIQSLKDETITIQAQIAAEKEEGKRLAAKDRSLDLALKNREKKQESAKKIKKTPPKKLLKKLPLSQDVSKEAAAAPCTLECAVAEIIAPVSGGLSIRSFTLQYQVMVGAVAFLLKNLNIFLKDPAPEGIVDRALFLAGSQVRDPRVVRSADYDFALYSIGTPGASYVDNCKKSTDFLSAYLLRQGYIAYCTLNKINDPSGFSAYKICGNGIPSSLSADLIFYFAMQPLSIPEMLAQSMKNRILTSTASLLQLSSHVPTEEDLASHQSSGVYPFSGPHILHYYADDKCHELLICPLKFTLPISELEARHYAYAFAYFITQKFRNAEYPPAHFEWIETMNHFLAHASPLEKEKVAAEARRLCIKKEIPDAFLGVLFNQACFQLKKWSVGKSLAEPPAITDPF